MSVLSELNKYDDSRANLVRTHSAAAPLTLEMLAPLAKSRTTLSLAAQQHAKQARMLPPIRPIGPAFESIPGHKGHVEDLPGYPSAGFAEAIGRRNDQQDAACAHTFEHGVLLGLFDGHGKSGVVAQHAAAVVPEHLERAIGALSDEARRDPTQVREALKDAFASKATKFDRTAPETGIQGALQELGDTSIAGCTALVAMLLGDDLYIVNLGDSRALLVEPNGVFPLSFDHKAKDEKARLMRRGSDIVDDRVEGVLAVSRSMGANRNLGTGRRPQVVHIKVPKGRSQIVLGCDGIFDVLTNEKVARMTRDALNGTGYDALDAAKEVICIAFGGRSMDNMSCIVWNLPRSS